MEPAARIDALQHFFPSDLAKDAWIDDSFAPLKRDFLPADLAPELARLGFCGSVAVQARPGLEHARWLLDLAEEHPFVEGVVSWVDLESPSVLSDLQSLIGRRKLVGCRHDLGGEADRHFVSRKEFGAGAALLDKRGLALNLLVSASQLAAAAEFARRFTGLRLVLEHLGKPEIRRGRLATWASDLRTVAECPNVSSTLSGLVTEANWHHWEESELRPYLDVAFDCFGPERLMIGSGWPVCTLAAGYARTMRVVTEYLRDYSASDQDAVLGGNAVRLFRLGGGTA